MICANCATLLGPIYVTICGHPFCIDCAAQPTHDNVPHTCLCKTGHYPPAMSLKAIQQDRAQKEAA